MAVGVLGLGGELGGSGWDGGGNCGTSSRPTLAWDDGSFPDCPLLQDLNIFVGDFGRLEVVLTGATSGLVMTLKITRLADKSALVNSGFPGW